MDNNSPLNIINFNEPKRYVLEASAGTGKTWMLERLFIRVLLEKPNLTISNILVVTFTNDATNELKERIKAQIKVTLNACIELKNLKNKDLLDSTNGVIDDDLSFQNDSFLLEYLNSRTNLDKDIVVLQRALQSFDEASIYTIHGFCHNILSQYAIFFNLAPQIKLVANKYHVLTKMVDDFIHLHILNHPQFTSEANILTQVIKNLEVIFSKPYNKTLVQQIIEKLPQDLFVYNDLKFKIKYKYLETPNLLLLTQDVSSTEQQEEAMLHFLSSLLNYLEVTYTEYMKHASEISYDELIQVVSGNILTNKSARKELLQDYPIAFIDEFQDTDNAQWQIFSFIYTNTSGTLVVVGDPKQAIYKFRGADIKAYLRASNDLNNKLILDDNYRSHPNIINFINQLFNEENQLTRNLFGLGINYYPLNSKMLPKNLYPLPRAFELNELNNKLGLNYCYYDEEVQLVSVLGNNRVQRDNNIINAMILEILTLLKYDKNLYGKIAILVSFNEQANIINKELRKYGIKSSELKLGNIFASTTASDLHTILLAILEPLNLHLLKQALTTNLFSVPLSYLASLESNIDYINFFQQKLFYFREVFEKYGIISLVYAMLSEVIIKKSFKEFISNTQVYKVEVPTQEQIEHTQEIEEGTASKDFEGMISNRELSNLIHLAELLSKQNINTNNSPIELVQVLAKKIEANQGMANSSNLDTQEEMLRLDNDDEQVIITTLHKSKGLEFDIIFCPFFKSNCRLNDSVNLSPPIFMAGETNELTRDPSLIQEYIDSYNEEINRLNYVALTRAKSRIYIYFKSHTTRVLKDGTKKYHPAERPAKLMELFGYVEQNPDNLDHKLFNYPHLFFDSKEFPVIKQPHLLKGVISYQRMVSPTDLKKLAVSLVKNNSNQESVIEAQEINLCYLNTSFNTLDSYKRQSYSSIISNFNKYAELLNDVQSFLEKEIDKEIWLPLKQDTDNLVTSSYKYNILNSPDGRGAKFGNLFHKLSENYLNLNENAVTAILRRYQVDLMYKDEVLAIMDEVFSYPLLDRNISLNKLKNIKPEMEFNLLIDNSIDFKLEFSNLIAKYYGVSHPFHLAAKKLNTMENGFLQGFIDIFFEYQGKYWVLDYKTNKLVNMIYTSTFNPYETLDNPLVESMANSHYYLQYILYLVAVKRHLEKSLKIKNATSLIGGAIYFYIRGIFVNIPKDNVGLSNTDFNFTSQGIYLDDKCQLLIEEVDNLFIR